MFLGVVLSRPRVDPDTSKLVRPSGGTAQRISSDEYIEFLEQKIELHNDDRDRFQSWKTQYVLGSGKGLLFRAELRIPIWLKRPDLVECVVLWISPKPAIVPELYIVVGDAGRRRLLLERSSNVLELEDGVIVQNLWFYLNDRFEPVRLRDSADAGKGTKNDMRTLEIDQLLKSAGGVDKVVIEGSGQQIRPVIN
jgi:hypothetical protein